MLVGEYGSMETITELVWSTGAEGPTMRSGGICSVLVGWRITARVEPRLRSLKVAAIWPSSLMATAWMSWLCSANQCGSREVRLIATPLVHRIASEENVLLKGGRPLIDLAVPTMAP